MKNFNKLIIVIVITTVLTAGVSCLWTDESLIKKGGIISFLHKLITKLWTKLLNLFKKIFPHKGAKNKGKGLYMTFYIK